MTHLKNLLKTPLQLERIPKWIPVVIILVALVGFSDATFLTVKHYQGIIPPCSIGGCEKVLTSAYSVVLGVPVSLGGAIFYFAVILLLFFYFDTKKEIFLRVALGISVFGLLASLYFITIMAFVLHQLCEYCALSACTSITIFVLSAWAVNKNYVKQI